MKHCYFGIVMIFGLPSDYVWWEVRSGCYKGNKYENKYNKYGGKFCTVISLQMKFCVEGISGGQVYLYLPEGRLRIEGFWHVTPL